MDELHQLLRSAFVIPKLTDLLAIGQECFLVGGAPRNALLGLPVTDFDFALAEDPTRLAREFAKRLGGHWFALDEVRRQSRVVMKTPSGSMRYDFAPLRASSLIHDLKLRDYTVNAMALPLRRDGEPQKMIDPLDGRTDLNARLLRCCAETVLLDDPLRVLKGVRHCLSLDLRVEPGTFGRMAEAGSQLLHAAPERIRAELGQIFSLPDIGNRLEIIQNLHLNPNLFGPAESSGGFAAGCELVFRVESWLKHLAGIDHQKAISDLFDETVEEYWPRRALLKLAAFLCGYRPLDIENLCRERFRFGRRATALLVGMTSLAAERFSEVNQVAAAPRGRGLWLASLGPGRGEALVLLAALAEADPEAECQRIQETLGDYLAVADSSGRIADLVDGDWLRSELSIARGPRIGELLAQLRRAEIDGHVSSAEDAREFLIRRCAK